MRYYGSGQLSMKEFATRAGAQARRARCGWAAPFGTDLTVPLRVPCRSTKGPRSRAFPARSGHRPGYSRPGSSAGSQPRQAPEPLSGSCLVAGTSKCCNSQGYWRLSDVG